MKEKIRPCLSPHAGSSTCPGCRSDFDYDKQRWMTPEEIESRRPPAKGKGEENRCQARLLFQL